MNKYFHNPDRVLDLHGCTIEEARNLMSEVVNKKMGLHVRVITGKGIHSINGPILRDFVKNFLNKNKIRFSQSKIQDGGEGALEIFMT